MSESKTPQGDFDNVPDCLYYPIEQVARIDLIDRNQTTYWGTNLKGGIIAITMKKGKALAEAYAAAPSPDVSVVTPLGYQTPAEFYSPTYEYVLPVRSGNTNNRGHYQNHRNTAYLVSIRHFVLFLYSLQLLV